MKKCNTCKLPKELSEYHKAKDLIDGHRSDCKECRKPSSAKYNKDNSERIKDHRAQPHIKEARRKYREEYQYRPHVIIARKERSRSEISKISVSISNKRTRKKYPNSHIARQKINNEINAGRITRAATCSECPSTKMIQGHHDDYDKPLDVRWLCTKCHSAWHKSNTPLNR